MTYRPYQFSEDSNRTSSGSEYSIIAGTLLLLAIMVGILAWGLYRDHVNTLRSAGERLQTQLRAYASAIDIAFMSADHVLRDVSLSIESSPGVLSEQEQFRSLLLRSLMVAPDLGGLTLYNRAGQVVSHVGMPSDLNMGVPPWVHQAMNMKIRSSIGIQGDQLGIARLVYGIEGEVTAVLLTTIESEQIKAELESGEGYGNQHLLLMDSQNRAMLVVDGESRQEEARLITTLEQQGTLDTFSSFGTRLVMGENYLFAIRQLGQQPIRAIVAVKRTDVLAGWVLRALVAGLCLGTLLLVVLLLLVRWHYGLKREKSIGNDLSHLYQALEQIPSAIAMTDLNNRIVYANPAYLARSGQSRNEILGQIPDILASELASKASVHALRNSLERGNAWEGSYVSARPDGSKRIEKTLITPVCDTDGCLSTYFVVSSDVTDQYRNEARLFRFGEIVNAADELMALLDTGLNHLQVNDSYLRYHGRARGHVEGISVWQLYSGYQLVDELKNRLHAALQGQAFVVEAWVDFAAAGRRFCRITGKPVSSENGSIESLVFNLSDMTERRQSEEALSASESRFRALAEFSPIGIFEADAAGKSQYINKYLSDLTGHSVEQLNEGGWLNVLHQNDRKAVQSSWSEVTQQQLPEWHCETRILDRNGKVRWFRCAARRYESDQNAVKYMGVLLDVTGQVEQREALERKNMELERLSTTDSLTQLANRARIEVLIAEAMHRYERYGTSCALIMLDIDHFKQVNDTCGHAVGDQVLRQLAQIMRDNTRLSDCPGRWGGEEFLIICPNTDLEGAHRLAENLRHRIERVKFPCIGHRTCSFGVTVIRPGEQKHEFLKRADDALYRAKANGRNQVVAEGYDTSL